VREDVRDSRFNITTTADFTSAHRLLREDGFDHVVRAKHIADKTFKIFFVRNGKKNARIGIIASKKILPGATQRNHAKRAIREIFRQHVIKSQQVDMVVMVKCAISQAAQLDELKKMFSQIINRCASL